MQNLGTKFKFQNLQINNNKEFKIKKVETIKSPLNILSYGS